jgi:hypothetical protein
VIGGDIYYLYGLNILTEWPLPAPKIPLAGQANFEIREGPASFFLAARAEAELLLPLKPGLQHASLRDETTYLRWPGLFEFLISPDGRGITARPLGEISWEAFHTYLLGQVFSFALLKQGLEPLHCTAVLVDGVAVGFLGDCGYGKSSLAAAFLQAGYPLLTDDLLVLKENGRGFLAYPSLPRIKLFPEIAQALLGDYASGTAMNPFTRKLIIPLPLNLCCPSSVQLGAFFILNQPSGRSKGKKVTIRAMSPRRAFFALTANTFNSRVTDNVRLKRQFALAAKVAAGVPCKSLSYPRDLARLPEVRDHILAKIVP